MIALIGTLCFISGFCLAAWAAQRITEKSERMKQDIEDLTDENEELRCELVKAHNELRRK